MIFRLALAAGLAATVAAAGCGRAATSPHRVTVVHEPPQGVAGPRRAICAAGSHRPVGSAAVAWAAIVTRRATAYRVPGGAPIARFARLNVNGVTTVLGVVGEQVDGSCRAAWLHVALPMRPNGVTGWVRVRDVQRVAVHTRISVDLSERRVRLYEYGRLVISSRAAVGSSATPTPVGRYYVNQRLIPADPHGPFGPGAVGISAFSPVLTGWAQGGPIAIHGTNEPWSIGRAVSNGCIRLPNPVLRRLFAAAVAGTPVSIHR